MLPVPGPGTYLSVAAEPYTQTAITGSIMYPRKVASNLFVLDDGGSPMTWFETSIDNGVTWVTGKTRILEFAPSTVQGLNMLLFEIKNLVPATYQVRVRFLNSFGAGAPSDKVTLSLI